MKIAVAGAFGFIGQHLMKHLLDSTNWSVRAISRSARESEHDRVECVASDLYSLKKTVAALKGCDAAVYLVHSMSPSSRLTQGSFEDFDYILADNFSRACTLNGINHIVYVGGMIPSSEKLSPHLKSRLEVEDVLKSHGPLVTSLRCGLVIGPNASSFSIIVRLTERLPVMILPQWMRTKSNPIYVEDLVTIVRSSLMNPAESHRTIDAGMSEAVSYKDIVQQTAKVINVKPKLIDVPYVSPKLSKLWVRIVSESPKALVYPLIDSVRHSMLRSEKHEIPSEWAVSPCNLEDAVKRTFSAPFSFTLPRLLTSIKNLNEVRSIQRLPLPVGESAEQVADRYLKWLPHFLRPFLVVRKNGDCSEYQLRGFKIRLLSLEKDHELSTKDRQLFRVTSGLLVASGNRGRFEFRESYNGEFLIVALHNFHPALPWPIYRFSQAIVHQFVVKRFAKHLGETM